LQKGLTLMGTGNLVQPLDTFHCRVANQAVEQWKIQQGLDPSLEGYEYLRDLPDWSFVDRCPTPSRKGQIHRKQADEAFIRWVAMLSQGTDRGLQQLQGPTAQEVGDRGNQEAEPAAALHQWNPKSPQQQND
uniref:Large ribosomal subunit protein mL52 n=1 Tax=Chelydra serpentina TaxID=8475 RepID=A0A8C3RW21_CHESE